MAMPYDFHLPPRINVGYPSSGKGVWELKFSENVVGWDEEGWIKPYLGRIPPDCHRSWLGFRVIREHGADEFAVPRIIGHRRRYAVYADATSSAPHIAALRQIIGGYESCIFGGVYAECPGRFPELSDRFDACGDGLMTITGRLAEHEEFEGVFGFHEGEHCLVLLPLQQVS
ncbi:hypothetical protein DL764_003667 [Monosporascus ibericus]|uniref:Uncharacterized protein n=1 Tax=Monosporascus ibericus TaxID=155417 RepID=A0A4Q4TGE2_9PEZI|nr:hypothetical protein DL764_003667 [Monosporascus ibericus]